MCCTWLAENTGCKKSSFWHHRTTLSGCIFAAEACIDNRKKLVKHGYLPHVFIIWWTSASQRWDLLASMGHPCKFQCLSRLGSVTARHSSSGRQPNFVALNRGHHLYSARRPSHWALAHILVLYTASYLSQVANFFCVTCNGSFGIHTEADSLEFHQYLGIIKLQSLRYCVTLAVWW